MIISYLQQAKREARLHDVFLNHPGYGQQSGGSAHFEYCFITVLHRDSPSNGAI
jgi:hypothetical protein